MRVKKMILIGIGLYAVSFILPAIGGAAVTAPSGWAPGYHCAWLALVMPFGALRSNFRYEHLEYFSMLISGWINPVFIIALAVGIQRRLARLFIALRTALLLMIPFCWIVYYKEASYPREGHFVWILGMLLALFSIKVDRTDSRIGHSLARSA